MITNRHLVEAVRVELDEPATYHVAPLGKARVRVFAQCDAPAKRTAALDRAAIRLGLSGFRVRSATTKARTPFLEVLDVPLA